MNSLEANMYAGLGMGKIVSGYSEALMECQQSSTQLE